MDILPVLCFLFSILLVSGLVVRSSKGSVTPSNPLLRWLNQLFTVMCSFPGKFTVVQRIWEMGSRKMGLLGLFFFVLAIYYSLGNSHDGASISVFLINAFLILQPGILLLLKAYSPLQGDREFL